MQRGMNLFYTLDSIRNSVSTVMDILSIIVQHRQLARVAPFVEQNEELVFICVIKLRLPDRLCWSRKTAALVPANAWARREHTIFRTNRWYHTDDYGRTSSTLCSATLSPFSLSGSLGCG